MYTSRCGTHGISPLRSGHDQESDPCTARRISVKRMARYQPANLRLYNLPGLEKVKAMVACWLVRHGQHSLDRWDLGARLNFACFPRPTIHNVGGGDNETKLIEQGLSPGPGVQGRGL
jgi:hypothetical protein